jgi:hypothetical protein
VTNNFDGDFDFSDPDDPEGGGRAHCDECGFDHETEDYAAREWHEQNPCMYCVYEYGIGHGPSCPTQHQEYDE